MAKNDDIVARFRAHADKQNCNRDMILGAVTASEKETKGCVDSLRGELRKVNGTMGSGIGDLKRGLERLQKTLVDDAKGRITALQARITELEAQNEEMIRTLEITSGALLPLKEALEMAVHGEFGDLPEQEARPVDEEARKANETTIAGKTVDLIEMSQTIRQGVLRLSSQCGGLFSIIFPDPLSSKEHLSIQNTQGCLFSLRSWHLAEIQEVESDFEGRWLKAMEAITDLRSEIRVKADRGARRAQHLQFYKFIIAQLREGRYSSILWGEALRGQSSAEFMSKDFGGFTTVQALAEDIQHLQTSLRGKGACLGALARFESERAGLDASTHYLVIHILLGKLLVYLLNLSPVDAQGFITCPTLMAYNTTSQTSVLCQCCLAYQTTSYYDADGRHSEAGPSTFASLCTGTLLCENPSVGASDIRRILSRPAQPPLHPKFAQRPARSRRAKKRRRGAPFDDPASVVLSAPTYAEPTATIARPSSLLFPEPRHLEQMTSVPNTPVDEATEVPQARQRFFHHHLTEAIRNRRVATAWYIYEAQKNRVRKDGRRGGRSVPTGLIHSLFALLAGAHPQTRLHYVRMKELADVLRRRGHGNVREWEWNALINAAGRGFRKTTEADYRAAIEVLDEWEADVRLSKDLSLSSQDVAAADGSTSIGKSTPSIQTYNILVSIAARTGSHQLYQDALHRLQRFTGKLDAVSYFTRITHYREKGQLDQIPRFLERMLADGLPLPVDGANAIIWAYASNGHLETAQQIYNTMIPNTSSSPPPSSPSISNLSSASSTNPILRFPSILKAISALHPDHRTYIMLVQAYAQAGQLASALDTLQDYLATISEDKGAQGLSAKLGHVRAGDKQLTAAFRGIFLGFVKYGTAGTRYSSKRAFVGMSLKEAASALLMNLSSSTGQSEMSVPGVDTSHFNTETLLSLFRFYIVLTTSHISEANHPIPLPPPQFVRTILMAFKNTALPETAAPLLNDVWATIVSQRLEPCGRKWLNQRDGWVWTKIRRDFSVDERSVGAGMDR
ncbi:hypothetical protein FRB90_011841 [Tulasnella sp. 427]|nr:hypothetical protein FRB90_011841 [Tulasnella sp. 427]